MRVLVVSVLAASLAGCSTSHQMLIDHTPRVRSTLTGLHHHTTGKIVARTKRKSQHHKRYSGNTKSAISGRKAERRPANLDDTEAAKVREIIAAKLGNPPSIKFPDIARGKALHSFCGVAEVIGASQETKELPFVYLAPKNEVYIIDGSDDRRASTAIRKMCD